MDEPTVQELAEIELKAQERIEIRKMYD